MIEGEPSLGVEEPFPMVVEGLQDILGSRLTALLGGVTSTRVVARWANAECFPPVSVQERLYLALHIAHILSETEDERVIRSWFTGQDPRLEDRSPLMLLRDGDITEVGPRVVAAGLAFVAGA